MAKMRNMEKYAFRRWKQLYGNKLYAEDFAGNLMRRDAYGNRNAYVIVGNERIYCGWNLHHVLPKACGGAGGESNLICTNIVTNELAGDKTTFWIDDTCYQVQKSGTIPWYDIIPIEVRKEYSWQSAILSVEQPVG